MEENAVYGSREIPKSSNAKYLILMADVIGSRELSSGVVYSLKAIVDQINTRYAKQIYSPLTITLGDKFQGVIKDFKSAVHIIMEIEELIIQSNSELKLRYMLNYGQIDTPINEERAYEMYGKGLTEARESLVVYKKKAERFFFDVKDPKANAIFNDLFYLYQKKIDNWSMSDYPLISLYWKTNSYLSFIDSEHYSTKSGAWKKVNSLDFESYSRIRELIHTIGTDIEPSFFTSNTVNHPD